MNYLRFQRIQDGFRTNKNSGYIPYIRKRARFGTLSGHIKCSEFVHIFNRTISE
jgi:hypothetical protein